MPYGHLKIARHRIHVTGRVHGVGFRYHVLKLAEQMRLCGFVQNTAEGVIIEVEGDGDDLTSFLHSLKADPPRYARVQTITVSSISLCGERSFRIILDA